MQPIGSDTTFARLLLWAACSVIVGCSGGDKGTSERQSPPERSAEEVSEAEAVSERGMTESSSRLAGVEAGKEREAERLGLGPICYTIGHSTRSGDELTKMLKEASITGLVDTRSKPYSRRNAQFNRERLSDSLAGEGIRYEWLGEPLGGMREEPYE